MSFLNILIDNEQLRIQFAGKANSVGAWIEEKAARISQISIAGHGTLEVRGFIFFQILFHLSVRNRPFQT